MGLFCLSASDSVEDRVKGAIANLQMFLTHPNCPHLLDFALNYINMAMPEAEAAAKEAQRAFREKYLAETERKMAWLDRYEAEQRRNACLADLTISK